MPGFQGFFLISKFKPFLTYEEQVRKIVLSLPGTEYFLLVSTVFRVIQSH